MARTHVVSVSYNTVVSNIVSLVLNLRYRAILSSQVLSPSLLWFEWILLFDVNHTAFKTFGYDFTVLENIDIYLSLSTSHVLVLLWLKRGSAILLRVRLRILLWCTKPHVERYWYLLRSTYIFRLGSVINTDTYEHLRLSSGWVRYSK